MGGCNSSARAETALDDQRHRANSFHENLVRQRTGRHRFEELYQVLDEIGNSGLCTIYKIRKRPPSVGAGPERRLSRGFSSWRNLHQDGFRHRNLASTRSASTDSDSNGGKETLFALKVIHLYLVPEDKIEQLKSEVDILKTLDHKNIIKGTYSRYKRRVPVLYQSLTLQSTIHLWYSPVNTAHPSIRNVLFQGNKDIGDCNGVVHRWVQLYH